MDACIFKRYGAGKDLQDAYKNAVADAQFEYGHAGYNCTISTTHGVKLDSNAPRFGTKAFEKYLNASFDKIEKWDPAYAVERTGKALKEYRKRHGLQRRHIRVFFFFGIAAC